VLDRKPEWAYLVKLFGKEWWRLFGFHAPNFRLGLQPPVGVPVSVWIPIISSLIAVRTGLVASAIALTNMIRWLVGVLNQGRQSPVVLFPDFQLLLDVALAAPLDLWAKKIDYAKYLIQVLEGVVQGCPTFMSFNGFDLVRDVVNKGLSCVLEILTVSPPWVRLFVIDLLIAHGLYSRMHTRHATSSTEAVLYLDEADQDVGEGVSDGAYPDQYSPLGQLLRTARAFGISSVVGLGVLGRVSPFVSSSFQYTFMFDVSEGEQILQARRTLLLPSGAEQMLPALPPGECILRESQGAWAHPVWCRIDNVQPSPVTGELEYDSHPYVPSMRLSELPHVQEALEKLKAQHRSHATSKSEGLSEDAHDLLHAACDYPWYPVARLWEKVGRKPSPEAQKKARIALQNPEFAEFDQIRVGKRNPLLIVPTKEGFGALHLQPRSYRGRGGIAHSHVCHWLAMLGTKQGYKVEIEALVPGTNHAADCLWHKDDALHVFEVVSTCEGNILSHLDACFAQSTAVTTVALVAFQKTVLEDLRRTVAEEAPLAPYLDRVRFLSAEQVLKETF
jgi:hypothetical protein